MEKKIKADPAAVHLPSFTLQPIVENAFSHGLKSCEEGGRILLRVWMQGTRLVLTVADNGNGMTPEELDALQEKIAQVRLVSRAKCCLIEREGMTEADAHRLIEKRAMDTRRDRAEIAQEILDSYED